MTRTGTKWIALALVLVMTAGAWAQRDRDRGRQEPDRRPDDRKKIDRDREHREHAERREHEERERREREQRERHEHEQREREQRERNERREHHRDGDRDGRRHQKPVIRIFRFENAPAESFMDVLSQLSRKSPLGEIMSKIPIALHQHSNAVVVIAPPEAIELFAQIADGLDAPSEFHQRMAQQRRPGQGPGCGGGCKAGRPGQGPGCGGGCKGQRPGQGLGCGGGCKGQRPGQGLGCGGGCKGQRPGQGLGGGGGCKAGRPGQGLGGGGGCKGQRPGQGLGGGGGCKGQRPGQGLGAPKPPARPNSPAAANPSPIREDAIKNAIGNPIGEMFGKLLSARDIRLDPQQKQAMHKLVQGCGQRVGHMHQRVIQAIKGMNPQQRAANARKTVAGARAAMRKTAGEVRKHIFGILKPEQRKAAARILGPAGSTGARDAKPSGGCDKYPKRKPGAAGGCQRNPATIPDAPGPCKTGCLQAKRIGGWQ